METEDKLAAVTESAAKRFNLKWTIEDFSIACSQTQTEYFSPDFQFKYNGDSVKFMIRLDVSSSIIKAGIRFKELKGRVQMKCEYILYNSRFEKLAVAAVGTAKSYQQGNGTPWSDLISWNDLIKGISHDDKLILSCKVITSNSEYIPKLISEPSVSKLQSSILNYFAKLRNDGEFSDMTISVRGKEFRVHKMILAARSPVFAAMFKNEMKEAKSNKVEIDDVELEVFEVFLDFIYSGKAKVEQYAWELLAAAEKYDVQDLKAISEHSIAINITHENCFKTLVLSDLRSVEKLKEVAMNYIVANAVEVDKNELAQLEDKSLILELMKVFMRRK